MVQFEVDRFLCESKVLIKSDSEAVLEKLFSLGFKWLDDTTTIENVDKMFLFIDKDKKFSCHTDSIIYCDSPYKEISTKDILGIKLELSCRPFRNVWECFSEMEKHKPFGWVKSADGDDFVNILSLHGKDGRIITNEGPCTLKRAFNFYTFIDDFPFGVKDS